MPGELKRSLPLYSGLGFPEPAETQGYGAGLSVQAPHPGLVFDKFIDTWLITSGGGCSVQQPEARNASAKLKLGSKRAWLEETIQQYKEAKSAIKAGLTAALGLRKQLITELGGECVDMVTDWRFVSGLGNGHPFETGFIWHRTLGVPYLPGSAVKGLMRAWADPEKGWGGEANHEEVLRLFGDSKDIGAGALIVFDALPKSPPELEVDIMNPHYGDYYKDPSVPPADYLSPKPIFFLAVKADQPFLFSLAPRPGAYKKDSEGQKQKTDDLKRGRELLKEALTMLGAGGKTAVGYGYFAVKPLRDNE